MQPLHSRSFNGKRFAAALVVTYVFVLGFEWLLHGWLLADVYSETAELWRTPEAMMSTMLGGLLLGYLIFVAFFAAIYLRARRTGALAEGASYGLLMGLLLSGVSIMFYAVQPLPAELLIYWCLGGIAEMLIAGMLLAAVYKERELFS